ncbi:MAG: ZIP family metal transporter [Bacteroidales bacterium]|nr:ZIP family metal transporter [Bacteroidales bacterium]
MPGNLYIYLILFFGVLLSGSVIFFIKKESEKLLKLLLSFSGAFLFAISTLSLIPEIYSVETPLNPGIFILTGFLIQVLLDFLTKGIEHGHSHIHSHENKIFPLAIMIGLCIHSFLEGMPLVDTFDKEVQHTLLIGIVIHNIPISILLMTLFLSSGMKKNSALLLLILFAFITPAGSLTSYLINDNIVGNLSQYFNYIMALVVGVFLHVSTSILFETSENHQYNIQKFITVILGALAAFLTLL